MITVEAIDNVDDRYCRACTAHRKPGYEAMTFVKVSYGGGGITSTMSLCAECAAELAMALQGGAEKSTSDLRAELARLETEKARSGGIAYFPVHMANRMREIVGILRDRGLSA